MIDKNSATLDGAAPTLDGAASMLNGVASTLDGVASTLDRAPEIFDYAGSLVDFAACPAFAVAYLHGEPSQRDTAQERCGLRRTVPLCQAEQRRFLERHAPLNLSNGHLSDVTGLFLRVRRDVSPALAAFIKPQAGVIVTTNHFYVRRSIFSRLTAQ